MDQQNMEGNRPSSVGKRVYASLKEEIGADPARIFPLLCPVAEYRWIDGWDCTLVYTKSGINEEGCVFTESMTGPVLTGRPSVSVWITDEFDPENHRIRFVIFAGGSAVIRYTVMLKSLADSKTVINMDFELTAMDEGVTAMEEEEIRNRLLGIVAFISQSLKHYCETGVMLKTH